MLIIVPGQEDNNNDILWIFFNMKVCCVFSLESPHQYTQYTIFNKKKKKKKKREKKIALNYPKSAAMFFFSKQLKNEW